MPKVLFAMLLILFMNSVEAREDRHGLLAAREKSKAALRASAERLNVIAENIANKDTTGLIPGEKPYTRKKVLFRNVYDHQLGTEVVKVVGIDLDNKPYDFRYEPGHPAADNSGYVAYPNVSEVIEMLDSKETKRLYEANLESYKASQNLIQKTMEIIR